MRARTYLGLISSMLLLIQTTWADTTSEPASKLQLAREIMLQNASSPALNTTPVDSTMQGGKALQGLGLCLGIFFVGLFFLKRYGFIQRQTHSKRLKVLERLPISAKASVVLVDCDGKKMLLGVGSEKVSFCMLQENEMFDLAESQIEKGADDSSLNPIYGAALKV